jgi:transposase
VAAAHPTWVIGFEDETWWSRLAAPTVHAWADPQHPMRATEKTAPAGDPDPKALACYGLLLSCPADQTWGKDKIWLRFVDGRPVSAITTQFLDWCCTTLEAIGKTALLMPWDNAPWHVSRSVTDWIHEHNQTVKQAGKGVRLITCRLPTKSPWLNPIEPHWMHGKRKVASPEHLLTAQELADRVCSCFQCTHEPHLALTDEHS